MQTYPPTKITMKTKTPLNPTSPYTIATTFMGRPTILTTITQGVTWGFSQEENPVRLTCPLGSRRGRRSANYGQNAAASQPTDDMQKFLNRWKD
jgi:hypothetical protein